MLIHEHGKESQRLYYLCNRSLLKSSIGRSSPMLQVDVLLQEEIDECVLAVALVWITLAMLPQATSKRWATGIQPICH